MNPWKSKVLAYNKRCKVSDEKATDLQVIIDALQPDHIQQLLQNDEAALVLAKYGYVVSEQNTDAS